MRGDDDLQEGMFSYISPEKRVPADHPMRPIRKMFTFAGAAYNLCRLRNLMARA